MAPERRRRVRSHDPRRAVAYLERPRPPPGSHRRGQELATPDPALRPGLEVARPDPTRACQPPRPAPDPASPLRHPRQQRQFLPLSGRRPRRHDRRFDGNLDRRPQRQLRPRSPVRSARHDLQRRCLRQPSGRSADHGRPRVLQSRGRVPQRDPRRPRSGRPPDRAGHHGPALLRQRGRLVPRQQDPGPDHRPTPRNAGRTPRPRRPLHRPADIGLPGRAAQRKAGDPGRQLRPRPALRRAGRGLPPRQPDPVQPEQPGHGGRLRPARHSTDADRLRPDPAGDTTGAEPHRPDGLPGPLARSRPTDQDG